MAYTSVRTAASIRRPPLRHWYKLVIESCLVQVWLHRSGRPPLHELDQGQVIGSTLEWQSLVDSLSYPYCLLLSLFI